MLLDEMKILKTQYGYSNNYIAQKSGVPLSTVQKVFGGITSPRRSTLEKLSRAFSGCETKSLCDSNGAVFREASGYVTGSSAEKTSLNEYGIPMKKDGEYTIEDYCMIPEDKRVELIDGVFYDMSAPSSLHQILLTELAFAFKYEIRKRKGSCIVCVSPMDVQLDNDDKTMVQPDLMIICRPDLKNDRLRLHGAPDLALEILSPSSRHHDMIRKLNKYYNAGVREYWIVDPATRKVYSYDFTAELLDPKIYSFSDTIPVSIYTGKITIDFSRILQTLTDTFGEDF